MLKTARLALLGLLVVGSSWTAAARAGSGDAEPTSAAAYLPDGLALVLTVRDGAGLMGGVRGLLADYHFEETPAFDALAANPGFLQARIGVMGLAAAAGTDAWTAIGSIAGDDMVLAVTPGKGPEAKFLAVSFSHDPAVRDKFLDATRAAMGLVRAGKPDPKRSRSIEGVTVFETDNDMLHGQSGRALIVSNSQELFGRALRAADAGSGPAGYRSSAERVPGSASAWLWIDGAVMKAGADPDAAAGLVSNPLGGLVFGGAWRSMLDAPSTVAWLNLASERARIEIEVAGVRPLPPTHLGFVPEASDGPGFDPRVLPGLVGEARLTRDWSALFGERESFLALPAAEQLVAFSSGVTALMGQMDFVDDVLPRFAGPVYLVAARQDFSPRGYEPIPVLPAFAMIMPLKPGAADDGFAQRLFSASLMAVSAGSLIAAQQGQPPFIIDSDRYRDCRIVTAVYDDPGAAMGGGMAMQPAGAVPADGGVPRVNIRYNFAPAVGIMGERYIIASSADLLRTVIDATLDGPPGARIEGDRMTIDAPTLGAILADNRSGLVANRMLEENRTHAEADAEIDAFLGVLAYVRSLSVEYRQSPDGFVGAIELNIVAAPGEPGAPAVED